MGKAEKGCPLCYYKLPSPGEVLEPYDDELNYYMWIPGFEWKPKPVREEVYDDEAHESGSEGEADEDMEEALAEMVEKNEMKEKFNEKASGGKIATTDAVVLARQLGLAPSYEDVEKFEAEHGSQMDYATFEQFAADSTHPEDNVEDLISAFSYFDPAGTGMLTAKQMRNILMSLGEPLTQQEMDIVEKQYFKGGDINYRDFCTAILARE